MFNASKGYGSSFDNDIWRPEGMPDAVTSDQGMSSFVEDQLKAKDMEFRMAGDALMNYGNALSAKKDYEAQVEAAEKREKAAEKAQGSGGGGGGSGGTFGKIAGGILGSVIGGPAGGAIGSGLGGAIGGLFG